MSYNDINNHVAEVATNEWRKVVAILANELADLEIAEEATQEAFSTAITQWPTSGIPQRPGAWLLSVARRKAIDYIKREINGRNKTELLSQLEQRQSPAAVAIDMSLVRDEQLQLIFSCCHPSLSVETQLGLTMRCVLGIPTPDVAKAFLISEQALAQRLVRGKRKIKDSVIPLTMPSDAEIIDRLTVVHKAIYLLYNKGYLETDTNTDFSKEAIRLAKIVAELVADDAEGLGLLALLFYTESRKDARQIENQLILLEDQDRKLWDWETIDTANKILDQAVVLEKTGPYQIQAAINALHAVATFEETDWQQIELLYISLLKIYNTPVIKLNYAIAVSFTQSPKEALKILDNIESELKNYHYFYSTKGELLFRDKQFKKANEQFEQALSLATNILEQDFLKTQIEKTVEELQPN